MRIWKRATAGLLAIVFLCTFAGCTTGKNVSAVSSQTEVESSVSAVSLTPDPEDSESEDSEPEDSSLSSLPQATISPEPVPTEELTDFEKLFKNGPLRVLDQNGLWGYVNDQGEYAIEPQFGSAYSFMENGLALVKREEEEFFGFINTSGDYVLTPEEADIKFVGIMDSEGNIAVKNEEKWRFINAEGETVMDLDSNIDRVGSLFDGLTKIFTTRTVTDPSNFYYGQLVEMAGYMDKEGKIVVPMNYMGLEGFYNGLAAATSDGEFYGYINKSGEYVIPPIYKHVSNFSRKRAFVSLGDGYAFIDTEGNLLTDYIFQTTGSTVENDLWLVSSSEYGGQVYIDESGTVVSSVPEGQSTIFLYSEGITPQIDPASGNWGCVDSEGNWIISPMFSNFVRPFRRGKAIVEVLTETGEKKAVVINQEGDILFDLPYFEGQYVTSFSGDYSYAIVNTGGLVGLMDRYGEWLIPPKFSSFPTSIY